MARVPLYEPQTHPAGPGDGHLRAANFGEGSGAVLGLVAQSLNKEADTRALELERQRQVDRTSLTADFADAATQVDHSVQTFRSNLAVGAAGHLDNVRTGIEDAQAPFMERIKDPVLRGEFAARWAQLRNSTMGTEEAFAATRRQESLGKNQDAATATETNRLITSPTPENLRDARQRLWATIDAAPDMPQQLRNDLRRDVSQRTAIGYLTGLGEQNPRAALDTLQSGVFDTDLEVAQRRALGDRFQADIHAQQAEVRRTQAAQQTQLRESIQGMDRRIEANDLPADSELATLAQQAQAAGLPNEAFDLNRYRVRVNVRRQYQHSTALEIRTTLGQMETRIAQAGDHAQLSDRIGVTELQSMLSARAQLETSDPQLAAQQDGIVFAPVDLTNLDSIRARDTAARAAQQRYGRYQFLNQAETARLHGIVESGPNGRMQVLDMLAPLAGVNAEGARQTAEAVAPNDKAFRQAIFLPRETRQRIVNGTVARATQSQRVAMGTEGVASTVDQEYQRWFNAHIQPSMGGVGAEAASDIFEAGKAIYADMRRQTNATGDLQQPDQGSFASAINAALGRSQRGGGMGSWSYSAPMPGSDGGQPGVVLPTRMNQGKFDRVMTWLPIARLGEDYPPRSIPNGHPRWANHEVLTVDQMREQFVPVAVGDGAYQFRRGGEVLITSSGRPFVLNVYELAAHPPARASARPVPTPPAPPNHLSSDARQFWNAGPQGQTYRPGVDAPVYRGN